MISVEGRELVNFSSNDYLGFAGEPALAEAAKGAVDEFGVGAGASRLVCGTFAPHTHLERRLAEFKGAEAALTFSSGYAAALGAVGALAGKEDVVILDKLCHASLVDGARLSGALLRVYPHNHLGKLESHLAWARANEPRARVLVLTESVFSMDGDRAPLRGIVELKERYGALLLLDEAHALGVVGANGRGLAYQEGLTAGVDIQMGTLGKALGASGGFICGRRSLIDLLINRARSFVYSTAPPPFAAAAASAGLDLLASEAGEERRRRLWAGLNQLAGAIPPRLLRKGPPASAIVPIAIGAEETALAASRWLYEKGIFIPAIRYPTVAKGSARLRVTLSATHTREQIALLCDALGSLEKRLAGDAPENPS